MKGGHPPPAGGGCAGSEIGTNPGHEPVAQRDPAPHPCEPERLSGASPQTRMGPGWNRAQIVGLDVSKAWLDGYLASSGRRLRVSNDAGRHPGELVRTLGDTAGCLVVMEASGGYERTAHRELRGAGRAGRDRQPETGARLRPRHGPGGQDRPGRCPADRALWRGDAPGADPCCPTRRAPELREILACRRQLIDEITVRKQQLEHLQSPAMRARVDQDPGLPAPGGQGARQAAAADGSRPTRRWPPTSPCSPRCPAAARSWPPPCWPSCPSSAASTAARSRALAGLAPVAKDSGLREHRRVIKGGRGQVRRALYMAAVASLRIKEPAQGPLRPAHRQRQAPKLALTALMRKMLVTLNAMLKAKTAWKDPRQK